MKIKAFIPIIVTCLVLALTCHFIAIASIDAPHNDSTRVSCGRCHGEGLLQSFWGGSGIYSTVDELCLYCHTEQSCPLSHDTFGPYVETHKDSNDIVLAECITCHDPHYQKQKEYKNTDWNNLYLAYDGQITSYEYNHPDDYNEFGLDPDGNGKTYSDTALSHTSVLTYSSITYKTETGWDAAKLTSKTWECRGTILFPNVKKLGYSYPIIAIDEVGKTITVKGDVTAAYQYISPPTDFFIMYGQFIKDNINGNPVKFFDSGGVNSFADGVGIYDGVCEVCHTQPDAPHFAGTQCTACHNHLEGLKPSSDDCMGCHSISFGGRAAIKQQFNTNSHHVQDVSLTGVHCYQCHWEAKADGTINNPYHEGYNTETKSFVSGEKVDLVVYGASTRPDTYTAGTTAIQYLADGTRTQIKKINDHCLSCHSDQNNSTDPFGDGKTPKQYAWDNESIDARYSHTGSIKWGKYADVERAAKKDIIKAYSAHGNAILNTGGWSATDGVDDDITNQRNGAEIIACFDCHNSHGSRVEGPTTSYTSATTNGGILKDTVAGKGGYEGTYKPQAGGSTADKNAYNAGAGLCFDCHLTDFGGMTPWGYSPTPWGYKGTFSASAAITGYWDTPYFGPGTFPSQQRYYFKLAQPHQGGHFGKSSNLIDPATNDIGGLCTPCHDPHGVSPTLNMEYSVPLLKGTWLTSLYKEEKPPKADNYGTYKTSEFQAGLYFIDQNTFGSDIADTVNGINESDAQFAGLCLNCHPKDSLTNGVTHTWKSKDRVHESVKSWKTANGKIKHNYPCSKCHTVHNSRLPRLMVTNCLDSSHKGFSSENPSPKLEGWGSGGKIGNYSVCSGQGYIEAGEGPCGAFQPYKGAGAPSSGQGAGHIPGSWSGGYAPTYTVFGDHVVECHENKTGSDTDQSWNTKTPWSLEYTYPEILTGPVASGRWGGSYFLATVKWTTRSNSTSYVDYGLTESYGSTEGSGTMWTNHNVALRYLTNHVMYYYRVRSTDGGGTETVSDGHSFYMSVGPSVPSIIPVPEMACYAPCPVTFDWNPSTDPDGGPVEYYVHIYDPDVGTNYTSEWLTDSEWTFTLPIGYWCWRVQARDGNHPEAISGWSDQFSSSCFNTAPLPSTPIVIKEPDSASPGPVTVTLEWMPSTSPLGNPVQYQVEMSDTNNFVGDVDLSSGWIDVENWSIVLDNDGRTWSWRVQARDAQYIHALSSYSDTDSFTIISSSNPPPAPTLIDEPNTIYSGTVFYMDVKLEWNPVTDPDGDPVEYYADLGPGRWSGWISGTSWTVTLPTNRTYSWRVKARDKNHPSAESPWSDEDSFAIFKSNPPPTPTLIDELSFASTVPVDVELQWNSVTDPDGDPVQYYVEIDASPLFWVWSTISSGWISDTSWTVNLTTATTWYWRVKAQDDSGATSPWSVVDSFSIFSSNPPPAPTLIDEGNIDSNVPVDVELQWNSVTDPDGDPVEYKVEVDDNPDLTSPTSPGWISDISWIVTLNPGKTWYWRVQAKDDSDATSPWSTTDSFVISYIYPDEPSAPTLISEPDAVSYVPVDITLEWIPITCPDGHDADYYVEVADNPDLISASSSGWISMTSWTAINLDPDTTWYWRVKARDSVHTGLESVWSGVDSFDTLLPIIDESFEKNIGIDGTGYDEIWTETVGVGCTLDPDSAVPGTPPPDAGFECLQSISAGTEYNAFGKLVYGSEQSKTFTRFYLYVEAEVLSNGDNKNIGILRDSSSSDVIILRLNKNSSGELRINLRLYNDGSWNNNFYNISLNTWYRIDVKYDDINNTWEWKVDGTTQNSGSLTGDHSTGIQKWRLGFQTNSQAITGIIYFDLFSVNTADYF